MGEICNDMQSIFETIKENNFRKEKNLEKITSERQLVLKDFLDRLNPLREKAGYKSLSAKVLAIKLGHISTEDLKVFYGICKDSKSFGACFWARLRK